MKINKIMTDEAILEALGKRLSRQRIDMQLTQADLAHEAGVSKRTVERIEAGYSSQTANLIRICRVLDLVSGFEQWLPETGPSPMEMVKIKGKVRKRASSKRKKRTPDNNWSWKT
ncbi:helix-turn-helix domain-containing protein [uncultured Desulfosarcina sp.]|uniref:helix-turn-helix domain-containing protein n=1 Tax=uncultured Desulfosarcina sp. TaxID=218289 RepID=UPI0029C8129F|nr:helix-turn-helix domain-containing protein [uncultured Desulfosarcina sp.]